MLIYVSINFFKEKICHSFHFVYIITASTPNTQSLTLPPLKISHKHLSNILSGKSLMFMKKEQLILISFQTQYKLQENQNFHIMNKRSSYSKVFCKTVVVGDLFSVFLPISAQCCHYEETSLLTICANQWTDFYVTETLCWNELTCF